MTRRNLFEQDLEDQKKEEEEKLLLDNVGFYALAVSSTSIIFFFFQFIPIYCSSYLFKSHKLSKNLCVYLKNASHLLTLKIFLW